MHYLWRSLIPGSHIPDYRRRLLELYLRAIESPAFRATRKQVLALLRQARKHGIPFNRDRYIACLPKSLPDDFRCWVLEWPEHAVIGTLWPGLHPRRSPHEDADELADRGGVLLSAHITRHLLLHPPGTIEVVAPWQPVKEEEAQALILDSLFVEGSPSSNFLMLRGRFSGADLSGKIYQLNGNEGTLTKPIAENWTEYLTQELEREDAWAHERESESLFG